MSMTMATLAAYGAALALTLILAAWLTPRAWWRRPNLKALAVLGGGTLAFGALFAAWMGERWIGEPQPARAAPSPALVTAQAAPAAGASYLVIDELNLRDGRGIRAQRVAVLPAGSRVTATGAFDGDWWRVRARVDGRALEGWASSLWLRRADERGTGH
jgi:hypothetical protein